MTDAVIAALIITVGVLAVAAGVWQYRRRKKDAQKSAPRISAPRVGRIEPPKPERRVELSRQQMAEAIDSADPSRQSKIHDGFVGVIVRWKVELNNISQVPNGVSVGVIVPGEDGLVHCYTTKEKCAPLIASPKGTPFVVTGKLLRVSRYSADLEECSFSDIQNAKSR